MRSCFLVLLILSVISRCDSQGTSGNTGAAQTPGNTGTVSSSASASGSVDPSPVSGTGAATNVGTVQTNSGTPQAASGTAQAASGGAASVASGGTPQTASGGAAQSSNGAAQTASGGAAAPSTAADGGAAQSTTGGAASATAAGGAASAASAAAPPKKMDMPSIGIPATPTICVPYDCQNFTQNVVDDVGTTIKSFGGAKWLKIKEQVFQPNKYNYYEEIGYYIMNEKVDPAMPIVVRVDCPPGHETRLQSLADSYTADYTDFNMTVANYIAETYQEPRSGLLATPLPEMSKELKDRLSVTYQTPFEVVTRRFWAHFNHNPLPGSHWYALEFAKDRKMQISSFYVVNYRNGNFEIWLTTDPNVKLFP